MEYLYVLAKKLGYFLLLSFLEEKRRGKRAETR